jgi:1,4-dihydroxy-6-naphthoate synthase
MDKSVMRQHIDLYVNQYSIDLGNAGQEAIEKLYEVYCRQLQTTQSGNSLFAF